MKSIGDIDKNLKIENNLQKDDIVFYNVKNGPFRLYGVAELDGDTPYKRMPKIVSENVKLLSIHTAGVRVRFSTNSSYVAIKAYIPPFTLMSHMTA
ncbi:MAG: SGNH/GDSL hydrolase N-terminal domain-containing protein, partial [Oscillospiraceae bacterium]